jgi:hypothetical protein
MQTSTENAAKQTPTVTIVNHAEQEERIARLWNDWQLAGIGQSMFRAAAISVMFRACV